MNSSLAFTILVGIFALGDIVANKTKAVISMIIFVAFTMLAGFWLNIIPTSIIGDSGIMGVGRIASALLVTSLGTMLDLEELLKQWKTVVIGILSVTTLSIFLYFIGSPIIGREMAIAGAPILSGGSAATLIMTTALTEKGLIAVSIFCVLLYVTQKFFGVPIASLLLKKEAKRLVRQLKDGNHLSENQNEIKTFNLRIIPELSKELQTPFVLLAKASLVVVLCNYLSSLTNGSINAFVLYLILGVFFTEIGVLEKDILTKANSKGLIMFFAMMIIFANLAKATPDMVASFIVPALVAVFIGMMGIVVISFIAAKFMKFTPQMAISIGISSFFGFPATYYLSHEVSNAVGETDEEKKVILDYILPKMLIAGFTTVTIASVVFAGFLINLI